MDENDQLQQIHSIPGTVVSSHLTKTIPPFLIIILKLLRVCVHL